MVLISNRSVANISATNQLRKFIFRGIFMGGLSCREGGLPALVPVPCQQGAANTYDDLIGGDIYANHHSHGEDIQEARVFPVEWVLFVHGPYKV